jgi:hypothetical protein
MLEAAARHIQEISMPFAYESASAAKVPVIRLSQAPAARPSGALPRTSASLTGWLARSVAAPCSTPPLGDYVVAQGPNNYRT